MQCPPLNTKGEELCVLWKPGIPTIHPPTAPLAMGGGVIQTPLKNILYRISLMNYTKRRLNDFTANGEEPLLSSNVVRYTGSVPNQTGLFFVRLIKCLWLCAESAHSIYLT
jgi:hypothetical protein